MGLKSWLTAKSQNHCRKALFQNMPRFVAVCQAFERCTPGSWDETALAKQAQEAYEDMRVKIVGTLLPADEALLILATGLECPEVLGPMAWRGLEQIFDAVQAESSRRAPVALLPPVGPATRPSPHGHRDHAHACRPVRG